MELRYNACVTLITPLLARVIVGFEDTLEECFGDPNYVEPTAEERAAAEAADLAEREQDRQERMAALEARLAELPEDTDPRYKQMGEFLYSVGLPNKPTHHGLLDPTEPLNEGLTVLWADSSEELANKHALKYDLPRLDLHLHNLPQLVHELEKRPILNLYKSMIISTEGPTEVYAALRRLLASPANSDRTKLYVGLQRDWWGENNGDFYLSLVLDPSYNALYDEIAAEYSILRAYLKSFKLIDTPRSEHGAGRRVELLIGSTASPEHEVSMSCSVFATEELASELRRGIFVGRRGWLLADHVTPQQLADHLATEVRGLVDVNWERLCVHLSEFFDWDGYESLFQLSNAEFERLIMKPSLDLFQRSSLRR